MIVYKDKTYDAERAFYGCEDVTVQSCRFDGPADGESAFKECRGIIARDSFFNLRYPFWHDSGLTVERCELTPLCRAALWYSNGITVTDTKLHGVKALRECSDVRIENCDVISPEFGWSVSRCEMKDTTVESEYFMMRSDKLSFLRVKLKGKYSFQYIGNSVFKECVFDTKDAFWHAKNVLVRDCTVKGEYLGWYCENVTFENCVIIGTQPLCYCKDLKLIGCQMIDCDLSFERSDVSAELVDGIDSVKNPRSGVIRAPEVGQIIMDDPLAEGKVIIGK